MDKPIKKQELLQDVDITKIKSSVLLRLIEEVKNYESDTIRAFDRVHVRHNRGG